MIIPTVAQESPNKKYLFFEKITKNKFKSNFNKKIIYSLSIFDLQSFWDNYYFLFRNLKK